VSRHTPTSTIYKLMRLASTLAVPKYRRNSLFYAVLGLAKIHATMMLNP
jgi:hypothetical protein